MKYILIALSLLSLNAVAEVSTISEQNVEEFYNHSTTPNFYPWLGVALPGRCFFKNPSQRKTASTLLTFSTPEGFLIAPLSADKRAPDFFDNLSFDVIVKRFPQYRRLTREVYFTHEEAILMKHEGSLFYQARIRELQDYFFVKVILKENVVRYCYYKKV